MNLLTQQSSSTNAELLNELISGDLCNFFSSSNNQECVGFMGGMMRRGLLGLNDAITSAAESIKDNFDTSPR
jgi:hypothetical protein